MSEHAQLLMVRRLAREAEQRIDRESDFDKAMAVSIMQDAIELLLWTACKERGAPTRDRSAFDELINLLSVPERGVGELPMRAQVNEINKARVNFKHYGLMPRPDDAIRLVAYGQAFVSTAAQMLFQVNLAALSEAHLIQNPRLREVVLLAEAALAEGSYQVALYRSRLAYREAKRVVQRWAPAPDAKLTQLARAFKDRQEQEAIASAFAYLLTYLNDAREAAFRLDLPNRQQREAKFNRLAPTIVVTAGGQESVNYPDTWTLENATFCVSFARDYATAVDRRLG